MVLVLPFSKLLHNACYSPRFQFEIALLDSGENLRLVAAAKKSFSNLCYFNNTLKVGKELKFAVPFGTDICIRASKKLLK